MLGEFIAPVPNIPQFSTERISGLLEVARTTPDDFRRSQLHTMARLNSPLQDFFEAKVAAFGGRGEIDLCDQWILGYTLGHSALRSAVPDTTPLPARNKEDLHGFAKLTHNDSTLLYDFIQEDYGTHAGILSALEELKEFNYGNDDGARFILGAFGRWANPTRQARVIPTIPGLSQPSGPKRRQTRVFATDTRLKRA